MKIWPPSRPKHNSGFKSTQNTKTYNGRPISHDLASIFLIPSHPWFAFSHHYQGPIDFPIKSIHLIICLVLHFDFICSVMFIQSFIHFNVEERFDLVASLTFWRLNRFPSWMMTGRTYIFSIWSQSHSLLISFPSHTFLGYLHLPWRPLASLFSTRSHSHSLQISYILVLSSAKATPT